MNELAKHNETCCQEVLKIRDIIRKRHAISSVVSFSDYPLTQLRERITQILREHSAQADVTWEIDYLDRSKFGADFAVRLTGLLKEYGAKEYIGSHVPWIAEALAGPGLADVVAKVTRKGIYVNVRLADHWFLAGVQSVINLAERFGHNDTRSGRAQVVDYSSPNVAKVLHAGHFRSTMIGHVLSNLYEACGAIVYRVNHINDFGGFGFILEGFRRFGPYFPESLGDNERLLEVYAIRRTLERAVAADESLVALDEQEREILARYFPKASTADELRASYYEEFVGAADERFQKLEEGDTDEVALWRRMVQWSLADFQSFYTALDIDIDFVIGESFYLNAGNDVVNEAIANGTAFELTKQRVSEEVAELDRAVAADEITAPVRDKSVALLEKDIGAIVVPLPGGERLVVRRSDGRSIYATRDLGAIKLRREIFDPTDINYVVGQEQRVHFTRLFQAAQVLGLATATKPEFTHTYFGFYVDAVTGKKLSSRESVAGVNELLAAAVTHFRAKSAEDGAMTEQELDEAAQQLAVGSVVFNDLKRDMKGSVSIARGDLAPIIADFEKSGGPYVVYSACRARAILRKYHKPVPHLSEIDTFELSDQEALLISKILEFPDKVAKAADEDNPSILVRHLLDIAGIYNSYYASAPVLERGKANKSRLMITRAAQSVLTNGLKLCHVKCPPKI
ncbi:MAG: arginine--tRNA ligase [Pseudonocardiaceae bacterium]